MGRRGGDKGGPVFAPNLGAKLEARREKRIRKFISDNQPISLFGSSNLRRPFSLLESSQERIELLGYETVPTSDVDHDFWTEKSLLDDLSFAFPWPLSPDDIERLTTILPEGARSEAGQALVASARMLRAEARINTARGYVVDQPAREIANLLTAMEKVIACRDLLSEAAREHLEKSSGKKALLALQAVDLAVLADTSLHDLPANTVRGGNVGRPIERHIALALHRVFERAFAGRKKSTSFMAWHNLCREALGLQALANKGAHEKLMKRARAPQIDT